MEKCNQSYFPPREYINNNVDPTIVVMLNCLKCEGCDRIPLQLQECAYCSCVVCKSCDIKIGATDTAEEKRRCPNPDCGGNDAGKKFSVQPFSSSIIIK